MRGSVYVTGQSQPVPVDVEVTDAVTARAEDGAVTARAEDGAVTARAEDGAVTARAEDGAVTARAEGGAVTARAEDGATWSVPLGEVTIEPGGFEADFAFCRPPDRSFTIAVNDPRFVPALEARADERLRGELAKVAGHRQKHHRGRWIGIGAVVVIVAVVVGIVALVPRMLAASVHGLPTSIDRQLGDAASAQVELGGERVDDPVVTGFVEQVVGRLEPQAVDDFDFRVRVVRSDQVNAFALPGGQIVVFTGLIDSADSPDQVAGVVAHEMAHVTLRHGLRNVAHRAGLFLALSLLLGDASGWVELAAEAAALAQANDYSREQESEADAEGVRMMMAAGLDPDGLSAFFRLLEEQPGSELAGAMSWLSTHPEHEARIAHVRALSETLPAAPRRPLDVDWERVRRAVE